MMVSEKLKVVFIAVPKTGTRSVYQWFRVHGDGKLFMDHQKNIPSKYKDYFKMTIVRNPYERLVSSWWSTTQRGDDPKKYIEKTLKKDTSFRNFCNKLELLTSNHPGTPHVWPQSSWLDNDFDKIIYCENLNEEWVNLPFNPDKIPLGHRNPTTRLAKNNRFVRKAYDHYLDKVSIKKINNFYREDFDRLNYEVLPWKK